VLRAPLQWELQAEVGVPVVVVVIREAGISKQAFCQWKAKYIGLEAARFGATTNPLVESLRLILMTGTLSANWKRRLWAFRPVGESNGQFTFLTADKKQAFLRSWM
jgi:hypothetical protein